MKNFTFIMLFFFNVSYFLDAQGIEDGLRVNNPNGVITARAASLGTAFYGIADDVSTLYYNPAGLALLPKSELSFGFGFRNQKEEVNFLNNLGQFTNNNEELTHIGLASPFKFDGSSKRSAIGFGYFKEAEFNSNVKTYGLNNQTTFINEDAQFGQKGKSFNMDLSLSRFLGLTNQNYETNLIDSLIEDTDLIEEGSIHNIIAGMGFELNDNISIGFSLTAKFGSYDLSKSMIASDVYNKYMINDLDAGLIDLNRFTLNENINQSISGFTAAFSFMGVYEDFLRYGGQIKLPTWYTVEERASRYATALFDDNTSSNFENTDIYSNYSIRTPFVYSGGVAIHFSGLTLSAGIEYSDQSQIKFSDGSDVEMKSLNLSITRQLKGRIEVGVGAEYKIPALPLIARISYSQRKSPYFNDIEGSVRDMLAIGGGLIVDENIRIDGVFRWLNYNELRNIYGHNEPSDVNYLHNFAPLSIAFGFTYRY